MGHRKSGKGKRERKERAIKSARVFYVQIESIFPKMRYPLTRAANFRKLSVESPRFAVLRLRTSEISEKGSELDPLRSVHRLDQEGLSTIRDGRRKVSFEKSIPILIKNSEYLKINGAKMKLLTLRLIKISRILVNFTCKIAVKSLQKGSKN